MDCIKPPKSRAKCLAILVEAVQALDSAKALKEDLNARTYLLKKKFLTDKETKIQIENELTKIMVQDLEEARNINMKQMQRIDELESERDVLKQRLANMKEKHKI